MLAGCAAFAVASDKDFKPEDLFDPTAASGALDMAETPWWIEVLKFAGVELSNDVIKSNFEQQFNAITAGMADTLKGKQYGELLRVQLFSDEFGTTVVPDGQLIVPVGVGYEPMDALAEEYRVPQLHSPVPKGLDNQSYYLWVKESGGKLKAGFVPRAFREVLEKKASAEAQRRDLLANWEQSLPEGGGITVYVRSAYWVDVADKYSKLLQVKSEQNQFAALQARFNAAEAQFNEKYVKFQETLQEMSRVAKYNRTLDDISGFLGIMSAGIQVGSAISSAADKNGNNTIRTDAKPETSIQNSVEYSRSRIDYLNQTVDTYKVKLNTDAQTVRDINNRMETLFKDNGVSIPKANDPLPIDIGPKN